MGPAPQKHKLPAAERRAAIISAAIDLFARKGFRGTTTRELAAAVGVSEPVLYQHFATKRDLYDAIVDHMLLELTQETPDFDRLRESADARECFTWIGKRILHWFRDGGKRSRLLYFSALEGHELAALWYGKATLLVKSCLEPLVQSKADQGLFRNIPASVAVSAFVGMVADYCSGRTFFGDQDLPFEPEQAVAYFVDIFLHGMETRAASPSPQNPTE